MHETEILSSLKVGAFLLTDCKGGAGGPSPRVWETSALDPREIYPADRCVSP